MKIPKEILTRPLFKATSLNGISILIKILIGLITSNIIARFAGPIGMALVGNLRNFLTTIESLATLGFENGVVKYVAEHKNNPEKLKETLSTVFITVFSCCLLLGIILLSFSDYFNATIFEKQYDYSFVFKTIALALPFYIGNIFIITVINGLDAYKKVIYITIIGNVIGLIVSFLLIWNLKTEGALLSIILTPSLLFIVSFVFLNKEIKLFKNISFQFYNLGFLKKMSSFSLMALVSGVFGSLVVLAIRKNIISTLGIEQAGFWEAMTRISSYYFLFITSMISIYFFPKMSKAITNTETKQLFWNYYKGILPIFVMGLISVYFLKDFIIQILFTRAFMPVTTLFFWQLIGDFFKAAALILGFQFFAKKMAKAFIISELISLLILYLSSNYFVSMYAIEGVVMAHAFTYIIYFIMLSMYFRKSLFGS